jgi:hypothetical protein
MHDIKGGKMERRTYLRAMISTQESPSPAQYCVALVGDHTHVHSPSSRADVLVARILSQRSISNLQTFLHLFCATQCTRPSSSLPCFSWSLLLHLPFLAPSSTWSPLDLAILADLFLVTLPATTLNLFHVTPLPLSLTKTPAQPFHNIIFVTAFYPAPRLCIFFKPTNSTPVCKLFVNGLDVQVDSYLVDNILRSNAIAVGTFMICDHATLPFPRV